MIRLFHASDLHFGCEDRAALDWFAACVEREKPDALAITGDLTMRARQREFDAAGEWIAALKAPATVEVGNHDLPYFNPLERFTRPYHRIRRIERLVEREIELQGLAIVPLKTTARAQWRLDWSKGAVGDKALAKTMDALANMPSDGSRVTLVTAHHPLEEAGTRGQALTKGGKRALAALAGAGVTAVLSGHVHDAFDLMRETANGPIRMIGAGTLSQRIRSTPPSFNELRIVDGRVEVRVRTFGESPPTEDMQIPDVPEDSQVRPGEPIAPRAAPSTTS